MWSLEFDWWIWPVMVALCALSLCGVWFGLHPMLTLIRRNPSITPLSPEELASAPLLSLVVYARDDEEMMNEFLRQALQQDYPNKEIIIVYDAEAKASGRVKERLVLNFPDVKFTFMPQDSHNVSRSKLAIMLGMKAAAGDFVLFTATNCLVPSASWLSAMMTPVCQDPRKEIVLGICNDNFRELHGLGAWYRYFKRTMTAASWLGYAIIGKPYRCDALNMLMKRDLFFRNKGFAKTMHLEAGEDDVFLQQMATKVNTAVVTSPDAVLTACWYSEARVVWDIKSHAHTFTERYLRKTPFFRRRVLGISQWVALASVTAMALSALPSLIPLCAGVAFLIALWGLEISNYRKAAAILQAPRLFFALPLFFLWRPVGGCLSRILQSRHWHRNFTWQRPKYFLWQKPL